MSGGRAPTHVRGSAPARTSGIPLDTHRAVEAAIGIALFIVPFGLRYLLEDGVDYSAGALFICAAIGLVAATLGFAGTRLGNDPSGGSHVLFDRLVLTAAAVAALVFVVRGEGAAGLTLGLAAAAYAVLVVQTRYVGPR